MNIPYIINYSSFIFVCNVLSNYFKEDSKFFLQFKALSCNMEYCKTYFRKINYAYTAKPNPITLYYWTATSSGPLENPMGNL